MQTQDIHKGEEKGKCVRPTSVWPLDICLLDVATSE